MTGPYKINGVPLRRVNQRYVIATSTAIDLGGVNIPSNLTDSYFRRPERAHHEKDGDGFFAQDAEKAPNPSPYTRTDFSDDFLTFLQQERKLDDHRIADQKTVDSQLLTIIKGTPNLRAYLNAKFSLKRGQAPHQLKF